MTKLRSLTGKELLSLLQKNGFMVTRTKGSHHRLHHPDGRVTTVPIHGNTQLPQGLLYKIVKQDLEMTIEEFNTL